MAAPSVVQGIQAGAREAKRGGGFGSILKTAGSTFFKATKLGQRFENLQVQAERIRDLQTRTGLFEEQGVREQARLDIAEATEARNIAKQEKLDAPVGMKQLLTGFGAEAQKNIRNFLERRDLIDDDTDSIRREDADEMMQLLRTTPSLQSELNRAVLKDFDSSIAPLEAQLQEVLTKAIEKTSLSKAELIANPGLDTSGKLEKILNQIKPLERDRGFVLANITIGKGQQAKTSKRPRQLDFAIRAAGLNPDEIDFSTMTEDEAIEVLKKAKEFGKATFDDFINAMINANQGGARPPGFLERILRFASSLRTGGELPLITEAPKSLSEGDFATGDQAILDTVTEGLR